FEHVLRLEAKCLTEPVNGRRHIAITQAGNQVATGILGQRWHGRPPLSSGTDRSVEAWSGIEQQYETSPFNPASVRRNGPGRAQVRYARPGIPSPPRRSAAGFQRWVPCRAG